MAKFINDEYHKMLNTTHKYIYIMHSILRYNHTHIKIPIDIPKEAPLMVVILAVRHCKEKCVAVLVVILMYDDFSQNSLMLTLLMVIPLYVAILTKIVWPFWK